MHQHIERARASDREKENAERALDKIRRNEELDEEETFALEAIILPAERPVVDIKNGSYETPPEPFTGFGEPAVRAVIGRAISSVGRIELPDMPSVPFGGTGFVVGENLLMTNRHVAELFARGLGPDVSFRSGQSAGVDFGRERGQGEGTVLKVDDVLMIHPYWDMALLEVSGLPAEHQPLELAGEEPEAYVGDEVVIIGYPAFDPRNDMELQRRIFDGVFNVKRLQPGKVMGRGEITSYGSPVDALKHDASTLGGNSGSLVLHVGTGQVLALHFAGRYLEANFAVPAFELARDRRVAERRIHFVPAALPRAVSWDPVWEELERPARDEGAGAAAPPTAGPAGTGAVTGAAQLVGEASWTIPLEISVRLGRVVAGDAAATAARAGGTRAEPGAGAGAAAATVERAVEPFHEEDYDNRRGYDERFLGIKVPMPEVKDLRVVSKLDDGGHEIPYEHFSLVMHKKRRLAIFTAANVDSRPDAKEPEAGKKYTRDALGGLGEKDQEKWFDDPRIPGIHQLPDKFFTKDRKSFDKGHVVRRDDVAWGESYDEVRRANGDTFHVTNCSPQVKNFNRSNTADGIWGKLENLVLKEAATEKLCVFGGPVLDDRNDREFRGVDERGEIMVKIPSRYWKVVVARNGNRLESFGFLLEQDLDDVSWELVTGDVEFTVPMEWKRRMVAIADLEEMIGHLSFPGAVLNSDQMASEIGESIRRGGGFA